ncbi:TlpA disulfide reductase family protein [Algoriphagus sp. C2-6-M1]|uniref:TlpA family protein disulfide reductase n=1 Tax=Algoriphagus persicinus TaxID=3108754 RepID=UPI002B3802C2|nr:TlpA disulfide reductase family protein [Algoriphagus sp. C2-6-M1]MEB2782970.1 TlpA disulfide reductase family protein [Algoriphagus sp. C2-6-M1]
MQKTNINVYFMCFFLGLIGLCSCNSGEKGESRIYSVGPGQIVLVFEDSVTQQFFQRRKAVFKYLDDNQLPEEISFNPEADFVINTSKESLDLVYRDNSQVEFTFFLEKGDSILIQAKDKKPWLTSISKERSPYDYNLELLRNTELYGKPHSKAQDFYFLWNETKAFPFELETNEDLKRIKDEAMQGFRRELDWLDSLAKAGLITEEFKAFYDSKNGLERTKLEAHDPENLVINTQMSISSILEIDDFQLGNRVYLDEFSDLILANQTQLQSRVLIDSLIAGNELNYQEKSLLFHYLQKEIPHLSFKEADEILERYGDRLDNPAQLLYLNSSNQGLIDLNPDVELMGLQKSFSSFEELLDQKKGNYLYIDLWAAWCLPCIKAFPATLALNESYKSKGVEVIFLSVDDNYKFWEEVAVKYDIAIPEQSFVAINKEESEYLKALDVARIPRYLIFDPKGKLIHPNAPRPESDEIRSFLEKITNPD